jgi:hypothetical protein
MGLTMHERHALVREQSSRFRQLGKKERSEMLDHFVQMTGYTRCYAAFVLRTCGRRYVRMLKGKRVVFIPGHARNPGTKRHPERALPDEGVPGGSQEVLGPV